MRSAQRKARPRSSLQMQRPCAALLSKIGNTGLNLRESATKATKPLILAIGAFIRITTNDRLPNRCYRMVYPLALMRVEQGARTETRAPQGENQTKEEKLSDAEIEAFLLEHWDEEFPGVVWDDSGRTVIDREAFLTAIQRSAQ